MRTLVVLSALAALTLTYSARAHVAHGTNGMVATAHPLATDVAVQVMKDGGNAVDAAVAAAFMLGVVDGHNSGLGGGCFALVRLADGQLLALDGREMAPAKAHRDMFLRDGKPDTKLSQTGALAVGIPGSLAVYEHLITNHGKKKLAELIEPAARIADDGFIFSKTNADRLKQAAKELAQFESSRRILLKPDGQPLAQGDLLKQPDLAASYRAIARDGSRWFYHGDFARATATWMSENGGIITADDFASYEMKPRRPLITRYRDRGQSAVVHDLATDEERKLRQLLAARRGYTIVGFPPPSSGGVHVAQILNILHHFDLPNLAKSDPAAHAHVIAEAMKLAFADRAHWLGDPDFVHVPKGLVDLDYGSTLAREIHPDKVTTVKSHGTPPHADSRFFEKHTTHIAAADADGNWVAITTTVNTSYGSKVIVPGTGIVLNNQMDDFAIQPGVRNFFGLVGSDANAIAPRKRPLSSMSPTIILKDDKPLLTLGAAGGPTIITQVVLATSNHIDRGDDLPAALTRPRFHHQWSPDTLTVENTMPRDTVDALKARGHTTELIDPRGATQAIHFKDGAFTGVSEPRGEGKAAGF